MSIDFPCSQCQRTIRVPDGSEGKKTKCPKCDAVQRIPGGATNDPGPGLPPADAPDQGKDPLWDDVSSEASRPAPRGQGDFGQTSNPFGETAPNPFASPAAVASGGMANRASRESAKSTLMGPAIATMVVVIMGVLGHAALFIVQALSLQEIMQEVNAGDNPAERIGFYIGFYGVPVVMTLLGVVCLFAMSRALQVRNYGFVLTGFIIAMIPCTTGYCCILALPFSIWGIVVMLDDSVKAAFRLP